MPLRKAKRLPSMRLFGGALPWNSRSLGLSSKSSSWLGAPAMWRKMTFLAFAGRGGLRALMGLAGSMTGSCPACSCPIMELIAMEPSPTPQSRKKWRRVRSASQLFSMSFMSYSRVMKLSVFKSARARPTRAAASAGGVSEERRLLERSAWVASSSSAKSLICW